jgi:hypothetical protein
MSSWDEAVKEGTVDCYCEIHAYNMGDGRCTCPKAPLVKPKCKFCDYIDEVGHYCSVARCWQIGEICDLNDAGICKRCRAAHTIKSLPVRTCACTHQAILHRDYKGKCGDCECEKFEQAVLSSWRKVREGVYEGTRDYTGYKVDDNRMAEIAQSVISSMTDANVFSSLELAALMFEVKALRQMLATEITDDSLTAENLVLKFKVARLEAELKTKK